MHDFAVVDVSALVSTIKHPRRMSFSNTYPVFFPIKCFLLRPQHHTLPSPNLLHGHYQFLRWNALNRSGYLSTTNASLGPLRVTRNLMIAVNAGVYIQPFRSSLLPTARLCGQPSTPQAFKYCYKPLVCTATI